MPGAELSPADKMCNSSATSTLCTDCAGTSPMYHVSQDICSAPSSGAGRPTLAVENSYAVYRGEGGGQSSHDFACAPRRNSGLCHVCTGGKQHKSAERKWARQWSIRPEVPFCHRTRDTKMPVGGPQRCKAVGVQRYASGRR
jgi:hypothetical protein